MKVRIKEDLSATFETLGVTDEMQDAKGLVMEAEYDEDFECDGGTYRVTIGDDTFWFCACDVEVIDEA